MKRRAFLKGFGLTSAALLLGPVLPVAPPLIVRQYWSPTFEPSGEDGHAPTLVAFQAVLAEQSGQWLPVPPTALDTPGAFVRCISPFIRYVSQYDIQRDRMIGRYDAWMATDQARLVGVY